MEEWKKFLNRRIKVLFVDGYRPDGSPHFSLKIGELLDYTSSHLVIDTGIRREGIAITQIIRFEIEK